MIKNILTSIKKFRRGHQIRARRTAFDAVYYLRRYPDLVSFSSAHAAQDHYITHGRREGRFPNAHAEEEAEYRKYLTRSAQFDLIAYRLRNPDLGEALTTDMEFILHYIRHGRAEGRPATFADGNQTTAPWEQLLSVSQFSAWASDWAKPPASRQDALSQFTEYGVERLTPLRFDYAFDTRFYRQQYQTPAGTDDAGLYKQWLLEGLPQGHAPNEGQLLLPYLGHAAFPSGFNWGGYAKARRLPRNSGRIAALMYLFERETDWEKAQTYFSTVDLDFVSRLARFRLRRNRARDADAIFAAWDISDEARPASLWSVRGDIDTALGRLKPALNAYERAIAKGDATLRTMAQAVRTGIALGEFDRAGELLRAQRDRWLHKADFERLVAEFIDRKFERLSADGHALLANASSDEAAAVAQMNHDMEQGLETIREIIEEIELAPAALGPTINGHVVLLGNEDLRQCTHYRIEQKQEQFQRSDTELRRHAAENVDGFMADLLGARAAIFYRVPATPAVMRAILTARRMGIPTYYEIDDLIFLSQHYPASYETYQSHISPADYRGLQFGVPLFRFALRLCDRAIASTTALLDHMIPLVRQKAGLVIRNGLDSRNSAMIALGKYSSPNTGDRVRIFYGSGTLAHNADFSDLVTPALARLMSRYANVDLVLVGHVPQDPELREFERRILRYPIITQIEEFWSVLSSCDINIAVLHADVATDCKSEIKWLEAAVLGIPTIASGTATYCDVIAPGTDGFIAATTEDWYEHLTQLVSDPALRKRVGRAARHKALEQYSLEHAASCWKAELATVAPAKTARDRLRVLVCNVFMAPQSIGGATRVVEDNISHIETECTDIELAAFCTDESVKPSGQLRTSNFGSTPVFRLAVETAPDLDSRPFNPDHAAAFRRVVTLFQPDLVHFHCIQRLTASVVRECLELKIPYLVTVHDAWWISPHQFLVDQDGILHLPNRDLLAGLTDAPDATGSALRRRRQLGALLAGAERVLAVSESFANIYRDAGTPSIQALPNGVPDLPARRAPDDNRGPLRLAHIGGRASHKGADLVEAALRCGDYPNLQLLMIDGHLAPGERIETQWGSSNVTLCAPFAQNDVGTLYGDIDVLLAPSRWPESFGLVAREAAHFGLWVVASRLGAMGEDIVEGENGFRIDTTDRRELDRILAQLNAAPNQYRQGTAKPAQRQRSARTQAAELASLYREIGFMDKA